VGTWASIAASSVVAVATVALALVAAMSLRGSNKAIEASHRMAETMARAAWGAYVTAIDNGSVSSTAAAGHQLRFTLANLGHAPARITRVRLHMDGMEYLGQSGGFVRGSAQARCPTS